ncbi:MAG: hypothetical protein ACTHJT_09160 [Cytophaga sp.]|uniref:hypothetical protein n=1 Tax=Cytophaga sp. TaxID=29535 RepID=UPI003F8047EA
MKEIILIENNALANVIYPYAITDLKGNHTTTADNNSFVNGDCNKLIRSYNNGSPVTTYKPIIHWENMLDAADLTPVPYGQSLSLETLIRNTAVKSVRFDQDNSLCLNTTNSFDTDINTKSGKLTLKAIRFYGRNQVQLLPSTNFKYDLTNPLQGNIQITNIAGDAGYTGKMGKIDCGGANNFNVGDIVTFVLNSKTFYCTLTKGYGSPNTAYDVVFLGGTLPVTGDKGIPVLASQTKNPPYSPEYYDIWGMFKSDYNPVANARRNNYRRTTDVSSKAVDCWNLRSIETPTGSTIAIDYKSDQIDQVELKNYSILNCSPQVGTRYSNEAIGAYTNTYYIYETLNGGTLQSLKFNFTPEELSGRDLTQYYSVNDKVDIYTMGMESYYACPSRTDPFPSGSTCAANSRDKSAAYFSIKYDVKEVGSNYIIVENSAHNYFKDDATWQDQYGITFNPNVLLHYNSFIKIVPKGSEYGGGLCVSQISVKDNLVQSTTKYTYATGGTAFLPNCYDDLDTRPDIAASEPALQSYRKEYYTTFAKIMAMAKDVVAPGVLYESVKVKNSVTKNGVTTDAPTYQAYQFQSFKEDMIGFENVSSSTGTQAFARTTKISDKTSQIGNVISIKTYDKNNRLLSEVSNNYTSTPENDQGIIEQVFHEQRRMNPDLGASWENKFASVTVKSQYPSVLISTTNKDYTKGITTTTNNTAFDFYTGAVTETQTSDSYGNTYMVINDPAYNWYDNDGWPGGMGLKLNSGVNMLTQNSGSYVIKKNASAGAYSVNVTSASISVAPKQILVTMNGGTKLPLSCHAGTKISGLTLPVFISWISKDRTQFKAISRASSITSDLGARTITMDNGNVLKAAVTTWSENWNYRQGSNQYGYSTASIQDYTYFPDQYSYITVDQTKWRIKSSYTWDSPYLNTDGTYPATGMGAFVPFDYSASGAQTSSYWKAVNTNTLYTQYSKLLESKDINNQYTSIKYSEDESLICGTAVNSKYTEFSIGSAEHGEGEFAGYPVSTYAHTGVSSYKLNLNGGRIAYTVKYNEGGEGGFGKGKQYRISAWVYKDNIADAQLFYTSTVNGTSTTTTQNYDATKHIKCGNWILMTMDITTTTAAGTDLKVDVGVRNASTSNYVYTDDFRFQPFVSEVQSYVYDKNTGLLTYVLGSDNRYVRYEYDTRGRLKATYKETTNGEVKMNEYNYNFARPIN